MVGDLCGCTCPIGGCASRAANRQPPTPSTHTHTTTRTHHHPHTHRCGSTPRSARTGGTRWGTPKATSKCWCRATPRSWGRRRGCVGWVTLCMCICACKATPTPPTPPPTRLFRPSHLHLHLHLRPSTQPTHNHKNPKHTHTHTNTNTGPPPRARALPRAGGSSLLRTRPPASHPPSPSPAHQGR